MANAQPRRAHFVRSSKGGMLLNFNNFLYRKDKTVNEKIYYKCRTANCKARVVIEGGYVINDSGDHHHNNDDAAITKRQFVNNLQDSAITNVMPLPHLYREQVANQNDDHHVQIPTFHTVKDCVYRARRKTLPPLPQTAADFIVDPVVTERCLIFDVMNDNNQRIIGFTSNVLIRHLADCTRIQFDGTFDSVPEIFAQLYILHGKVMGTWQPLVFTLLPSKDQATYQRLWQEIHNQVRIVTNRTMLTNYALGDFEVGALNSVLREWPNLRPPVLKGCLFHYNQAVLRKAKQLGLWIPYREDNEVKTMVRHLMALPLMPPHEMDEVWLLITANAPGPDHPNHQHCNNLLDYMVTTWVDNDARFHRDIWNHYAEDADRTTNAAESSHHRINTACGKHRLNIHAYCRQIMTEIINSERRIVQLEQGFPAPPKKRVTQTIQNRLTLYRTEYVNGTRTLRQFLDAASFQLHNNLV